MRGSGGGSCRTRRCSDRKYPAPAQAGQGETGDRRARRTDSGADARTRAGAPRIEPRERRIQGIRLRALLRRALLTAVSGEQKRVATQAAE